MASPMRVGRGRFWRLRLLGLILSVAVIGTVGVRKLDPLIFQLRLRTAVATFGVEESRLDAQGVILRREQVVLAPAPGRVTLLAGEGRRVRSGDVIAELNDVEGSATRTSALDEINRELNQVRASMSARLSEVDRRISRLEERLAEADRSLRQALSTGDERSVESAAAQRDQSSADLAAAQAERVGLQEELAAAEEALVAQRESALRLRPSEIALVRAPASGVVSFALDGMEALQPGAALVDVRELTPSDPARVQDGVSVERGAPLYRLVDATAPVELVISATSSTVFEAGTSLDVAFDHVPEQRFGARLTEVIKVGREWFGRLVLESPDPSLVHRREVRVTLFANRAQGIVVPARAVIENGERTGVYVMLGDRPVFREVSVLGGNEQHLVIDGLSGVPVGATVVRNPAVVLSR